MVTTSNIRLAVKASPLAEIQASSHHGGQLFISDADEVMDILAVGRSQGLEAEVDDDDEGDLGQLPEGPIVSTAGPRGMQCSGEST